MLLNNARRRGRGLAFSVVLRKQHYMQACAQLSIFVYWGYYWREVYAFAYLIVEVAEVIALASAPGLVEEIRSRMALYRAGRPVPLAEP